MSAEIEMIERRLRSQVAAARMTPPPDLERRIVAALDDARVATPSVRPPVTPSMTPSYLSAAGLLVLAGTLALSFCAVTPSPLAPAPPLASSPGRTLDMEIVIGIDTTRYELLVNDRAGHLLTAFESPLFDQARRIAADARHAVGTVLSRIPAPIRVETTTLPHVREAGTS